MAVYKRTYVAYEGAYTPQWSRFLILPRVSYKALFQTRFLLMFLMACFFYPLGAIGYVYIANNLSFLETLRIPAAQVFRVDANTFLTFCWFQGALAYTLTSFVGPTLISPDLTNNALPLYFCRPFSRTEYLFGKASVLMILLSMITWIPGLVVWAVQASLAGWTWARGNLWIAGSLVAGLVLWIAFLSLIALTISAWVKWRVAAGALLLGVFLGGAGLGSAINQIMRTQYGSLLNLTQVIYTIWSQLFDITPDPGISVGEAWTSLGVISAVCLLLLSRKVRPFEVVR